MTYRYKIFENVSKNDWNSSLLKFTPATYLQTFEYLSEQSDSEIPVFIFVFDDNNVVGQLGIKVIKTAETYSSPTMKKFLNLITKITRRGIWVYGPLINSTSSQERSAILEQILTALDDVGSMFDLVHMEGHTPPLDDEIDENYKNTFKKFHYSSYDEVTFIANLEKTNDDLWNDLPRKSKGDINRAKRRNIIVKELETFEELKEYSHVNIEWARSKGLTLTNVDYEMDKLWRNHTSGIEKVLVAFQDSHLISGMRIGCFNNVAYTNYVVNSYSLKSNLGGSLLNWFALEWAKEKNMKFYDFSGGPLNGIDSSKGEITNSLLFYKTKWGGSPKKYYDFKKVRKKNTYKIYSLLFKLLVLYHKIIKH